MSALLALIPGKDLAYGAAIIALLIGFGVFVHHERSLGAAAEVKVVQEASAKVQAAAAKQIAELNTQHAATVAAIQETQSVQLKAAAADSATLSQRLRNYEARNRCPNPVLGSPASPDPSAYTGPGSAGSTAQSPVDAALAALIAAAEHDNAVLVAERAERDSLTGKP